MVYGFGDNVFAILGGETAVKIIKPTVIEELCGTNIKKVVFGERFMVALTESHEMYTGGYSEYGRCGNGVNDYTYCKPNKIFTENQLIVDIRCGKYYTAILTDKQQVYAFGYLCDGNEPILSPTLIRIFEEITSISCEYYHVLGLSQTGKVYAWGNNEWGQLGLKHSDKECKPTLIQMPNNVSVKQISCGSHHSLLLTTDGDIYSFGHNGHGQLGLNHNKNVNIPTLIETTSKFTEILAFGLQSFALNESNIIEFWGQNIVGVNVLSPQQTKFGSLQEAIIHKTEHPFNIEPIVLKKDQNFSEKNKCPSNRLMKTLAKGFNNPANSDFRFRIKRQECDDPNESCPTDDPNNGYDIIYCHKWIIEENCDYLKKMFANIKSIKESNEMEIKGYSYKTYHNFIQYLYTDSIETKDIKLLNEMLLLSDMYSEEELKTRCVSVIKLLMNVQNVCNIYCSAINNKSSDLEEYCFEFMTKNIKSIIKTEGWEQMDAKIGKTFYTKYIEKQN